MKLLGKWRMSSLGRLVAPVLLAAILVAVGCTRDESAPGPETPGGFDRGAGLKLVADNLIIPSYEALDAQARAMDSLVNVLASLPTQDALNNAREAWKSTMRAWMKSYTYNFGPAENIYGDIAMNISTFPVDTASIETRISNADTSTTRDFKRDTRGLLAMDYLLFGSNAEQLFLIKAPSDRAKYLVSLSRRIRNEVAAVLQGWKTGYREAFISKTGTDVGSGYSMILNSMARSYEDIKNYKLGLPAGLMAGHTTSTYSTKVEAYYSGISLELIQAHFNAIVALRKLAFADYLKTIVNGETTLQNTEAQEAQLLAKQNAITTSVPLSQLVSLPDNSVVELHNEYLKLTRFYKSELSSLIGVSITYSSGDGD